MANSATQFGGRDNTTQGNWVGVYGADGGITGSDYTATDKSIPGYLTLSHDLVFADLTTDSDARSIQRWSNHSVRWKGVLYGDSTPKHIATTTTGTKCISLYFYDYQSLGSVGNMEVRDSDTNITLITVPISDQTANPFWVRFNCSGNISFWFISTGYMTLGGIMFDPEAGIAPPSSKLLPYFKRRVI